MAQIDPLHSTFHFPAANVSGLNKKNEKTENTKAKKSVFSSIMDQKKAETDMLSSGLPVEIASMDFEEAFVYLKDQADIASDVLKADFSLEAFSAYRKSIGNLMKFIVHSNYEVEVNKRRRPNRRFKTEKFYLIQVIDEKLDRLASDIISTHLESLEMLSRIDEINGILIDLIT